MLRLIVRRCVLTLPVLLGVVTLVFALIHLIPGDPARAMLGEAASDREVADLRQRLGLDRPLSDQFASYVAGLARADLGTSLRTGTPVTGQIAARVPATAELAVAALLMAVAVALPVGVFAAIRQGRAADRLALAGSLVVVSMPSFWLGPLLAIVFGIQLGWLPVSGRGGPSHLILPAASLGAALAAVLARMTRASLAEQLRQPYVVAAHARGASTSRVVLRHALPNCLVPIVTLLGLQAGALLTGAVITETIFAWPGVGRLLVQAIGFRDYPVVQGCILFIALTYVVVNLATDLIYAALDPRIRYR